jgi:tetratricopeptide (TPR) repeat protein
MDQACLQQDAGGPVPGGAAEALTRQGVARYGENCFRDAEVLARAALETDPGHALARNLLAACLFQGALAELPDGDLARAEHDLRQIIDLQVALPGLREALAQCLFNQAGKMHEAGQAEAAALRLRQVLLLRPECPQAREMLAASLFQAGLASFNGQDYAQSVAQLREALELRPHFPEAAAVLPFAQLMRAEANSLDAEGRMITPYLEMDIAYTCNLHCDGCTHYSNYTVKGHVEFETGRKWILAWGKRLYPKMFRLLGGEPTLNPRLGDYLRLASQVWPLATRELVTNGFFIRRHPDLFETLAETRTAVQISLHEDTPEYRARAHIDLLREASERHGFRLRILRQTQDVFYRLYRGTGAAMLPFEHGQPAASWDNCGNGTCQTLHLGRLWKCPAIAFLNNIDEMFDLAAVAAWQPYLQHKGLSVEASHAELVAYFGEPSYFCAMCPATRVIG